MRAAARFLHAMAHALDLRAEGRGDALARRTADEACAARLTELVEAGGAVRFGFSSAGVTQGSLTLAEFDAWPWAGRLAARGIESLEIRHPPMTGTVAVFLDVVAGLAGSVAAELVRGDGFSWGDPPEAAFEPGPLQSELLVLDEVFAAAERNVPFRPGDVNAVLASLEAVVDRPDGTWLPLVRAGGRAGYQSAHAINTALLALATADALGMAQDDRREAGRAALLHDIGMTQLPQANLLGAIFTSQDRARVRGHPLEGARLLLRQSEPLDTAAVVAYEHHLRADGSGYPRLSYPREPHPVSRLIAACDAFDARLASRPDRPATEPAQALRELERAAVTQFDPRAVAALGEVVMRTAARGTLLLTSRAE